MPTWLNIALTIFYVVWLVAVLLFLWLIWRNGTKRANLANSALIDSALISANAAKIAAEAAHVLAQKELELKELELMDDRAN